MCNLSEGIVDRVTERVTAEVTARVTAEVKRKDYTEYVKNLMASTGLSLDQAMDALEISGELREDVRQALSQ